MNLSLRAVVGERNAAHFGPLRHGGCLAVLPGPAVSEWRRLEGPRSAAWPPRSALAGATLLTAAVALAALGLVMGEEWGWGSPGVLGSLAAVVVLAALFAVRSARHPAPAARPRAATRWPTRPAGSP
ncbi:hypothetical protein [Spirillospora sp. CA-294931]|uniref:hypothetical protein n=1 Tax=Spirillospora sp. CA-294931 TaxID=3240042 RepID=UPI003D8A0776